MKNSQTNFYEFQNRDYIDWIISLLNSEPSQMITEKTYSNIFKNGSEYDKLNLLALDSFAKSLNSYALDNYINTTTLNNYYTEPTIHFAIVLKVDDLFLLIESASYTYDSYTFITALNNYNNSDYIVWDLYSKNKRPQKIEKIIDELNNKSSELNSYIQSILNSELFKETGLSDYHKKDLVTKFILHNLE